MNVTLEDAYAEACCALGEAQVRERLLSAEVQRLNKDHIAYVEALESDFAETIAPVMRDDFERGQPLSAQLVWLKHRLSEAPLIRTVESVDDKEMLITFRDADAALIFAVDRRGEVYRGPGFTAVAVERLASDIEAQGHG